MTAGINLGRKTKTALNRRLLKVFRENGIEFQIWNPVTMSKMLEISRDPRDGSIPRIVILRGKDDRNRLNNFEKLPVSVIEFVDSWFE